MAARAIGLAQRAVAVRLAILNFVVDRRRRTAQLFDVVHRVALDIRIFWLGELLGFRFGHGPSILLSSEKHAMSRKGRARESATVPSRGQIAANRYMLRTARHHKSLITKG